MEMYDEDPMTESEDKCDYCELYMNCTREWKDRKLDCGEICYTPCAGKKDVDGLIGWSKED